MHRNLARIIPAVLLVFLLMPCGMLLATEMNQPPAVTSSTANRLDAEQASNLLNQMQTRVFKVRKEVEGLRAQGDELPWQVDSATLSRVKNGINAIVNDLAHLDQMKSKLEPWQQSMVDKITPAIHQMVHQTDAAINTLNAHQNRASLLLFESPQNINRIYKNANKMAKTIQTGTQYARAEQKMAGLGKMNRNNARS